MNTYSTKYKLNTKPLGSGGAAIVFPCVRISDGEQFAIKILSDKSKEKIARFQREIDVMQDLCQHQVDGILPIVDADRDNLWYVMPVGDSVKNKIEKYIELQAKDACPTAYQEDILNGFVDGFIQLAETLEQIHQLGYVHRDIKPDNLYVMNERFCIGDFGIVDTPETGKGITKKHDHLGAWNTIAPEVLRDARSATAKADVYSLAKTLWMCLSLNCEGFDGRYDYNVPSMSLHDIAHMEHAYLLDIDELLSDATQDDPNLRPSMREFAVRLLEWKRTNNDLVSKNRKEWDFVYKAIFNNLHPPYFPLEGSVDIARALNLLARYTHLNYTMMPRRGGLTLEGAEPATELDCICLDFGYKLICKPKRLVFRGFKHVSWNYFYLELEQLDPILKDVDEEELIEDIPGHYVDATYSAHGVYDYETGVKLPDGWRKIERIRKGSFLVVSKLGFYNNITPVTDGRHSNTDENGFYDYICQMKADVETAIKTRSDVRAVLQKYWHNPFDHKPSALPTASQTTNHSFISSQLDKLNFSDLLDGSGDGNAKYSFTFNTFSGHSPFEPFRHHFLCTDGFVRKLDDVDPQIFYAHDREKALKMLYQIEQRMKDICLLHGFEKSNIDTDVEVHVSLVKIPEHVFNYRELNEVITKADDRVDNTICIDENGYVLSATDVDCHIYPVSYSRFSALSNYVGPYSNGMAQYIIKDLMSLWLQYLQTGYEARYAEDNDNRDIGEIKEEIKKLINEQKGSY